ncbi:DNA-binding CsgD family transcriptional regulator [Microbacterium sp. SORGH_AS 1204]|uniref:helix-turn-helix transcriptional regulator n=1 Tax=Microbacterium sp. SORGH_AS_1204 TaxID=3041785 RepID=UPI00278DC822|nr:LuxR family transcriptional regulator [Microbacterium sp. SORGH_AS_1204]MDQ1135235.1 DNA-binding CsgD family transcriptional regulator [Microbacterium sp. SORGH_AS_1204]
MPGTPASIEARAALRVAAATTAQRLCPGHGVAVARHLALLSEAEFPDPPIVWTDTTALSLASLFAARARRDALAEGADAVARYFQDVRLIRPASLSSGARSQLYASVGEYCNAIGWPQVGARFGAEALLFADTDATSYRALSVKALGYALNGEYISAEAARVAANELFRAQGWDTAETAYLLLLAEALVASARLDVPRLLEAADAMRRTQPDDPYWGYSARAIEVMSMMFRRDLGAGRAEARRLLHGSRRLSSHRMMRYFLVSVLSDILVAQGEYREALSVLEPFETPEGHGVCFSMQRSAALLRLGRERELLLETDACVASGADHCLRTLTPLLVRRALSLNRLGYTRRAHQSMEAALHLITRTGSSATPFLMLPHEETRSLMDAVAARDPELADIIPYLRAALARVATPDAEASSPLAAARLTPTEAATAELLLRSLSLVEIARERGVSLNTVKSQVRSIYQKLGVGGRAEAVELLASRDT